MARQPSRMPAPPNKAALEDNPELEQSPVSDLDGQPELDVASEAAPVEMPPVIPKPILKRKLKVTANREGFIHQERKQPGAKFEVTEQELGSWMDCEDPVEQKKHLKRIADKKRNVNQRATVDHAREIAADE